MKIVFIVLFSLICSLFSVPRIFLAYAAPLAFGNGVYTNLCGTGAAATANTCNKGCNPATGTCTSDKPYVIKWTCSGNVNECRLNETPFAMTQNIGNTPCGQTVSIQVYNRNCRTYFGWICNDANLQDSMQWYSGNCENSDNSNQQSAIGNQQLTTNNQQQAGTRCEELSVIKGNNATVPVSITLHTQAVGATGYRYYFGDGTLVESANSDATHTYDVSGAFVARAEVKNSAGVWTSSNRCETTVAVKSSTLETQKSDCSDLFVVDGNESPAPATVSLRVTGYDNKGAITKYKITGEDNQSAQSPSGAFQMKFEKAGTYILRASILDSANTWKAGGQNCTKTVYIQTQQLTRQPETGTPTALTVAALVSGILGIGYFAISATQVTGNPPHRPTSKRHGNKKKAKNKVTK